MVCDFFGEFETSKVVLRLGSLGPEVSLVQRLLESVDPDFYTGEIDGDYGRLTEKAVKRFQAARLLAADGVVGPKTRSELANSICNCWHSGFAFAHPQLLTETFGILHPELGRLPGHYGRISTFGGPYDPYDRVWGQAYIRGTRKSPAALAAKHPALMEMGIFRSEISGINEWPQVRYRTLGGWAEGTRPAYTSWALDSENAFYCAMKWSSGPTEYRDEDNPRVLVWSENTRKACICLRTDWGPRSRLIDVSPCALRWLGVSTDDYVSVAWALDDAKLGPVDWRPW